MALPTWHQVSWMIEGVLLGAFAWVPFGRFVQRAEDRRQERMRAYDEHQAG